MDRLSLAITLSDKVEFSGSILASGFFFIPTVDAVVDAVAHISYLHTLARLLATPGEI